MTDMSETKEFTNGDSFWTEVGDDYTQYLVRGIEQRGQYDDLLICEVTNGSKRGEFVTMGAGDASRYINDGVSEPDADSFPDFPQWERNWGDTVGDGNPHPYMTVTLDKHEVMVTRSQLDDRLLVEISQWGENVDPEEHALRIVLNDGTIWDQSTSHEQLIWVGTVIRPEDPLTPQVYLARSEDALIEDMFKQNGVPEGLGFSETGNWFEDHGLVVTWDSHYLIGNADTLPAGDRL